MDEHNADPESTEAGSSTSQRVVQVLLLLLGGLALFWLYNIFALNGDIAADTTEALTQTTWGILTIIILALVLVGELVLLFFRPS